MVAFESDSDEELLRHICEGSRSAFAALVKRHSGCFYRVAYRFIGNHENAEDIVQESFLKLWEYPEIWNPRKNVKFTTWLYRVVVNRCLDYRKRYSLLSLKDDISEGEQSVVNDDSLIRKEEQGALEKAIYLLPERQRVALNLCFYEEVTNQEAADIMGVHLKAVQSLLMRAKENLRERMQPYL